MGGIGVCARLKWDELKPERDESEVERGADKDKAYTKERSERGADKDKAYTKDRSEIGAREERERSGQRQGIHQTPTGHTGNTSQPPYT